MQESVLDSAAQTVVNPVNTAGVMGAGLAREFRQRHPEMYEQYRELCRTRQLEVGQLWLWRGGA